MNISKFCKTYDNKYITQDNYLTTCISNNIPSNNIPSNNIPSNNIPSNNVPLNNVPSNNVPSNNIPSNNIPSNNVPPLNNIDINKGICKYIDSSNNIKSTDIKCDLNIFKSYDTEYNKFKSVTKNANYISNLVYVSIPPHDKKNLVKIKPTYELIKKLAIENNISTEEILNNLNYYMSNIDLSYNSIIYNDNISGFEKQKYIDQFNKLFIIEPINDNDNENDNNSNNYFIIFIIVIIIIIIIIIAAIINNK